MVLDRRNLVRTADQVHERANVDIALAKSKRLIADIDVLLEHSHQLIDKQAVLGRSWR